MSLKLRIAGLILLMTVLIMSWGLNSEAVSLSSGEYEVVVAIDPTMANDTTMIDKIKTMMKDASKYLHTALKEQGIFGTVTILVPDSWPDDPSYLASEGETVAGADIFVGKNVSCGACASPGRIEIDDGQMVGSTVVHEWGHYRFGLGDEYCDYVYKNSNWYQIYKTAAGWNSCTALQETERNCEERIQTGASCTDTKNNVNGAKASIMHRQWNTGIDSFCDDGTDAKYKHNSTVNNHQNRVWGNKSTWAVIGQHTDGFKYTGGTKITYKDPVFKIKKAGKPDIILVIDVSGSMSGTPLTNCVSAAKNFIDRAEVGSYIGIVQFSDNASLLLGLTEVKDNASRTTIKNSLPTTTINMTSIGAGMQTAMNALKASTTGHKKVMALLTDGGENTSPYISSVLPSVVAAKIKVYSVGLGAASDSQLQDVATQTGGTYYFAPSGDVTALNSAFTSIVNTTGSVQSNSMASKGKAIASGATETLNTVIDSSIGRNTVFTYSVPIGTNLGITLRQPNGTILDSTYSGYAYDAVSGIYKFSIAGTAQTGTWTSSVKNNGTSSVTMVMEVTSANLIGQAAITLSPKTNKTNVTYPEPIIIEAKLTSTESIIRANVWAEVTGPPPNNTVTTLTLRDNGQGADKFPMDGSYAAYFTQFDGNGRYTVTVFANNTNLTAEVGSQFKDGTGIQSDTQPQGIIGHILSSLSTNKSSDTVTREMTGNAVLGENFERISSAGSFQVAGYNATVKIPPGKITTLNSVGNNTSSVALSWIATGNSMDQGTAAAYDLRFSKNLIATDADFNGATVVAGIGAPKSAGEEEKYTVINLEKDKTYYFAVKAVDTAGNKSEMSNVYQASTTAGGGAPGSDGGGGGCFIATAAYGSYMHPHVMALRDFRDHYLITNSIGKLFVGFYYTVSPPIAEIIRGNEPLRVITRIALTPIVFSVEYPAVLLILIFGGMMILSIRVYGKRKKEKAA